MDHAPPPPPLEVAEGALKAELCPNQDAVTSPNQWPSSDGLTPRVPREEILFRRSVTPRVFSRGRRQGDFATKF